jgi:hypothetical protein
LICIQYLLGSAEGKRRAVGAPGWKDNRNMEMVSKNGDKDSLFKMATLIIRTPADVIAVISIGYID